MKKVLSKPFVTPDIFKAYDIRGRYPAELNERVVAAIASAYAVLIKPKKVVLGRDVRLSGPSLYRAVRQALLVSGVQVIEVGVVPVDVFYFAVCETNADGGLFISASHNPQEWNGLNLTRKGAEPISENSGLKELYYLTLSGAHLRATKRGRSVRKDVLDAYFRFILKQARLPKLRPLRVLVNGNFGVSAQVFKKLVRRAKLPLTLIGLNDAPDGRFPKGPPNPLLLENREEMKKLVITKHADVGIAWDADGDRSFFVDEKGTFIEGYFITALLAQEMLRQFPGATVLSDPRLVWATKEVSKRAGGRLLLTRAGMTLIAERMKKEKAVFAGEMSGHYYFRTTFNRDSGFLPALLLLGIMARERKPLSALAVPFTSKYHISGELNFIVGNADAVIKKAERHYAHGRKEHIDGLSVEFSSWRFNLRKSNTEPLLRLNVEAKDQKVLEHEVRQLKKLIVS